MIQANLDVPGLDIVINENWKESMASSLLKGVNSMNEMYPHVDGVIILVGDQPHINNQHIDQLIDSQNLFQPVLTKVLWELQHFFTKLCFRNLCYLKEILMRKKISKKGNRK